MSHLKERTAKDCLNCKTEVQGKYCHVCGQENIEPVESAWHLIQHFLYDLTHFDGKFFSTIKTLLFKPGFLSAEYVAGRRASYLNPLRMYIFTSAFFFLVFFSAYKIEPSDNAVTYTVGGRSVAELRTMDSLSFEKFSNDYFKGTPQSREVFNSYLDSLEGGIHFFENIYRSRQQYDSLRRAGAVKDSWLRRQLIYREIAINKKYGHNRSQIWSDLMNRLTHAFPQLLFISLPLFALVLKLLYIRRKRFYYAAHLIFSVNLYIFAFMVMLLIIGISKVDELFGLNWLGIVKLLLIALVFFYEYKSMRKFYAQNRAKTIMKFFLLNLGHFIIMLTLIIIGFLISLMNI